MDQNQAQQENKDTPGEVGEPQLYEPEGRTSATSESQGQDIGPQAGTAPTPLTAGITYKTRVDLYVLSTGSDEGPNAELYGSINLPTRPLDFKRFFPVNNTFFLEEGRKGRWIAGNEAEGVGVPRNFMVSLYEDDSFGRKQYIFQNKTFDFTSYPHKPYANGQLWTVRGWNTSETDFKATLAWSVTPAYV